MRKTVWIPGVRPFVIAVVVGLVAYRPEGAAAVAANAAPVPSETPVAVVTDATAARAALEKADASKQALVADLTLGHEGKLVRSQTATPLSPGRYRLHALAALTAKDGPIGDGVALRLATGENQRVCDPAAWIPQQGKLSPVQFDFVLEKAGPVAVAADWIVQGDVPQRQNAINKLSLQAGPGKAGPAADDADLGDELGEPEAKFPPPLAPRSLAGKDLPAYRLMLTGLVIERLSPVLNVRIDGRECFTMFTPLALIAGFDLTQPGKVEIECARPVQSVSVRPTALGIRPTVAGNKISFPLDAPASLSVEIDGDIDDPLLLFADPPDQDAPKPGAPGVKFFAAGKVHDVSKDGNLVVASGETVYIERGAVVRGSISIDEAKNVKIRGRGILEGGLRAIQIARSEDVVVEGVTILRPSAARGPGGALSRHWTVPILRSDRVTIRGVKIVSDNQWDDGVVVVGSNDVTVEKCFIRTKDACVAVKAGGVTYFTQLDCQRNVENVTVKDCVLWNGEHGSGLEISTQNWLPNWLGTTPYSGGMLNTKLGKPAGFEPRATEISKIRFINNDLIHVAEPTPAFTIQVGDESTVRDVIYENTRVEDSAGPPVDLTIIQSPYNPSPERGHVRDIVFRNVRVEAQNIPPSAVMGFDDKHPIEGVVFENVQGGGRKWAKAEDGPIKTEFAKGVAFR